LKNVQFISKNTRRQHSNPRISNILKNEDLPVCATYQTLSNRERKNQPLGNQS